MKSIKLFLQFLLKKFGYHFQPFYTLKKQIEMGKYKWLEEYKIKTLLDVGANIGEFSNLMKQIIHDLKVYAFEPIHQCYFELENLKEKYKDINTFNYGLGENIEDKIIYKNIFAPSSSLFMMNDLHVTAFPYTKDFIEEKIKIVTLDSLSDQINYVQNVLLKIDVQGFEKNVLNGAKESLNKIAVIIIETSFENLFEGGAQFDEIYQLLTEKGFIYKGNYDQIHDPRNWKVLQADAIFVNSNLIK
ncbi:MAG: FkbM family methyltransferase [Bacteroidetes bacterium]|nr:FkbM family methyltransferase [Bacteroidota bacterium]